MLDLLSNWTNLLGGPLWTDLLGRKDSITTSRALLPTTFEGFMSDAHTVSCQDNVGWAPRFGLLAGASTASLVLFWLGESPVGSPITMVVPSNCCCLSQVAHE